MTTTAAYFRWDSQELASDMSVASTCYERTPEEVCDDLEVDPEQGLSSAEAATRLEKYGPNQLHQEEKTPLWQLVLEQFDDLLVKILLGAAMFSFVTAIIQDNEEEGMQAFVEPAVILIILVLNAIVGVWQESNAENALDALKKLQPKNCKCVRDGKLIPEFGAENLVPGDIVEVYVGEKLPADLRIIKLLTTTLRADESALTGESATVLKQHETLTLKGHEVRVSSKVNMLFSGTTISGGKCRAVVISTGMDTEIGKIQKAVSDEEDEKTPLKQKLDDFGELLSKVIGLICLLVFVMNYNSFWDPVHKGVFNGVIYYLKIAVALGVAAIPEGLPAVITLCLALGTRRMVKKNAIIRRLPSVETLGCVTVICSDKTGTLTLNEMTAVNFVYMSDSKQTVTTNVSGTSYNPTGQVEGLENGIGQKDSGLSDFAACASLCNDAQLVYDTTEQRYVRVGEPTEAAMRVLAEKIGYPGRGSQNTEVDMTSVTLDYYTSQYSRVATLEFSRGRKSMSVLVSKNSKNTLMCKGAPESVISRCNYYKTKSGKIEPLTAAVKKKILESVDELAGNQLRTLACAMKNEFKGQYASVIDYDGSHTHKAYKMLQVDPDKFVDLENEMIFLGLAGIKDPARAEVAGSIAMCREAGIRVIMITGDKKETAESIAREIGIFTQDEDIREKSFTGKEFMSKPREEQKHLLMHNGGGRTFSRTDPTDKQHLVNLLKECGEVPSMTGDGVNDAPALKAASIGVAMGIAGTEVAKEASDMVLADDNFATIVAAVEEGRAIYSNMKAFIRYLISSNIGEVASIFLTALLGLPEGLIPVQLLWVNLVTDGPPATALGFNPADADIMKKPPRRADDQLITSWVFFRYMVIGLYVGLATVGIFVYWYLVDFAGDGHTTVSWNQLTSWSHCSEWASKQGFSPKDFDGHSFAGDKACEYFTKGKERASTLSLSVLVAIEMFNALNAISEDSSLLTMPPWVNPWLLLAMTASMLLHCVILYIPFLAGVFEVVPLNTKEWIAVVAFSFPVVIVDELLKCFGRCRNKRELQARLLADEEAKKNA